MPAQHPDVTPGTAKALYANAVTCAAEDCSEPLYRSVPGGARVLNSRISHICARSENGPRWDPSMTPAENQSPANLLILCLFHADVVDKAEQVQNYPVTKLQHWKADQIAQYDRAAAEGSHGWRLSDAEAVEVVEKSDHTTVNIAADTIYVGGMGGTLGGAGGGGGVIGGGFGGLGGKAPAKIILNGQHGQWPGGAPGGGGVMFDPWSAILERSSRIAEGSGHARTVDDDATIPSGARGADALRLSALTFANYVSHRHGLVHVIEGVWQNYSVAEIPTSVTVPLLCVFEAGRMGPGSYEATVSLRAPSGEERVSNRVEVVVEKTGSLVRIPYVTTLVTELVADDLGLWSVVVEAAGTCLGAVDLMLKQRDDD